VNEVEWTVKVQKTLVRFDRPIRRETAGLGETEEQGVELLGETAPCRAQHASDPRLNAPTVLRAADRREEMRVSGGEERRDGAWSGKKACSAVQVQRRAKASGNDGPAPAVEHKLEHHTKNCRRAAAPEAAQGQGYNNGGVRAWRATDSLRSEDTHSHTQHS
jgi:hypothetical protein